MSLGQCNPQSKILWHLDRVHEWQETGDTKPVIFEIDPSNKCNQNCPWCTFADLRSKDESRMCWETMKSLLDSMKNMGVKAINWTGGGEPLFNPHTIEGIRYADSLGLDQGIFTNGALITKDKADIMASHMTWVRVSLDAYTPESYAKSHGTHANAFNKVLENIKYLSSIKHRCTVGVGFLIYEDNFEGIEEITKLVKETGADYIQFKPIVKSPGEPQIDKKLIEEEFLPRVRRAELLKDDNFNVMVTEYRFKDVMDAPRHGRHYKKCLSQCFQGAVGADSKVYVCDHHKGEPEYEIGDLKEDSLEDIWASDKRKKVIEWLDSTDLSQCQHCCRNHELNKLLWHISNKDEGLHPNHL